MAFHPAGGSFQIEAGAPDCRGKTPSALRKACHCLPQYRGRMRRNTFFINPLELKATACIYHNVKYPQAAADVMPTLYILVLACHLICFLKSILIQKPGFLSRYMEATEVKTRYLSLWTLKISGEVKCVYKYDIKGI